MTKSTLFGRQAAVIMMDQSASSAPIAAQAGAFGCGWKMAEKIKGFAYGVRTILYPRKHKLKSITSDV